MIIPTNLTFSCSKWSTNSMNYFEKNLPDVHKSVLFCSGNEIITTDSITRNVVGVCVM